MTVNIVSFLSDDYIVMDRRDDIVLIGLTRDEVQELFERCIRSHDEDTPTTAAILRKLARAIESLSDSHSRLSEADCA